jgi:hypothetical protein
VTVQSAEGEDRAERRATTSTVISERRDHIDAETASLGSVEGAQQGELGAWDGAREMRGPKPSPELPPGE